jgi:hypothetical protein
MSARREHGVLLAGLVVAGACASRAPAVPPPPKPVDQVSAFVVNAQGPIAGLDVRLVELPDGRCPCGTGAPEDEAQSYGNEMPACRCREALAAWHRRLGTCQFPARAVSTVTTDERGQVTLTRSPGVNGVEVAHDAGVRWTTWPAERMPISLELAEAISPKVVIANDRGVALHGAFLFDDGHCIPLDRQGDAWGPRVPMPRLELSDGTLVIEAQGYQTIVDSLFDQDRIDLELRQDDPISGTCEEGVTASFDNPFQHLTTKLDANKQWSFTGVLAMSGTITCWENAQSSTDEYEYSPEYGIQPKDYAYGSFGPSCDEVHVIDQSGKPVAGAALMVMHDHGGGMSSGESGANTDDRGIGCVELSRGARLEITAPSELGGECAGQAEIELTAAVMARQPYVFRLRVTRQRGTGTVLRGRVVTPEGVPVAGAYVSADNVQPLDDDSCSDGGGAASTGADGRFALPELPRGTMTITVQHDWYAKQELTIKHDGTPHDIVVSRGATWTGRVLDPEGHAIKDCTVWVRLEDQRLKTSECKAGAFSFGALSPGPLQATVRIQKHSLGTYRNLVKKITIAKNETHVEDLAFPRGEDITGRVVDAKGREVPGARKTALPNGTKDRRDRFEPTEIMLEADEHGRFTFRHLTPGTWTIKGDHRSRFWKDVEVKTGTRDLVLVVPDPPVRAP